MSPFQEVKYLCEKGFIITSKEKMNKIFILFLNYVFVSLSDHSYPNIPKNMPGTSNLKELLQIEQDQKFKVNIKLNETIH